MATGWVSRISGPIPNHHIYDTDNRFYEKNPKIKVNKTKLESKQFDIQGKGCLGSFSNRAVTPKDHIQENVKRIREIHRAGRQRQEENKQNRGPLKSTSRPGSCVSTPGRGVRNVTEETQTIVEYDNTFVGSENKRIRSASCVDMMRIPLGETITKSPSQPSGSRDYLKAHEKTGPPLELNMRQLSPLRKEMKEVKISVPKASTAREVQLIRRDIDFVKANAYAARSARMRRSPSADSLLSSSSSVSVAVATDDISMRQQQRGQNYRRGEIPAYLVRRRKQWKDEEDRIMANQPDPEQPPGHRKMPEKERITTLELLKTTEKDMLAELGKLPIRTDTLRLRTRKQEIEQRLNELEEAIKIFSKPKVFIRVDN